MWALVQPRVAEFTRVISYDRAGYGRSDPARQPRTAKVLADELHGFLVAARILPPYVLVGHAFGGFIARLYTRKYPDEVSGLVLIDANHEDEWSRGYPEAHRRGLRTVTTLMGLMRSLALLGIPRLVARMRAPGALAALPDERRAAIVRDGFSRRTLATVHQELRALEKSAEEVRGGDSSLGERPLIVITHGRAGPAAARLPAETAARIERLSQASQRHLAVLSNRSEIVVAGESGREVMIEQPDVVVGAIRTVVEAVREARRFVR
jgi:pimeloyl-ACP methyl ester carboxylesterase